MLFVDIIYSFNLYIWHNSYWSVHCLLTGF